jgi:hypothetical protein
MGGMRRRRRAASTAAAPAAAPAAAAAAPAAQRRAAAAAAARPHREQSCLAHTECMHMQGTHAAVGMTEIQNAIALHPFHNMLVASTASVAQGSTAVSLTAADMRLCNWQWPSAAALFCRISGSASPLQLHCGVTLHTLSTCNSRTDHHNNIMVQVWQKTSKGPNTATEPYCRCTAHPLPLPQQSW